METKKTALVTGGSRGIGRAICLRLAKDGMNVIFSYRSGEEMALETQSMCREHGVEALGVKADVKNVEDCDELIRKALDFGQGKVDVLVNNAGITKDNLLIKIKDEDLNEVLDVNVKGTFYMMRGIARVMLKQKSGSIVNLSSVVGLRGNPGQVNYAASKAAVIGMTKSLAKELSSRQIRVNAVAPGMINTDMTAILPEAEKEKIMSQIPFGKMGTAQDVANTVAFLAGDESRYITGQVICVDGGMAM